MATPTYSQATEIKPSQLQADTEAIVGFQFAQSLARISPIKERFKRLVNSAVSAIGKAYA